MKLTIRNWSMQDKCTTIFWTKNAVARASYNHSKTPKQILKIRLATTKNVLGNQTAVIHDTDWLQQTVPRWKRAVVVQIIPKASPILTFAVRCNLFFWGLRETKSGRNLFINNAPKTAHDRIFRFLNCEAELVDLSFDTEIMRYGSLDEISAFYAQQSFI